ncbi:hypothetical protein RRG08_050834 [Elysia crispata]|uniref:Uncharacterized protein n=1 Tax=Elysia crispata TaxID=231223 RepID=A0AAE1AE18_9GAST|nr:hypothetical protein RRG08_050834 [Elysia crispata]
MEIRFVTGSDPWLTYLLATRGHLKGDSHFKSEKPRRVKFVLCHTPKTFGAAGLVVVLVSLLSAAISPARKVLHFKRVLQQCYDNCVGTAADFMFTCFSVGR